MGDNTVIDVSLQTVRLYFLVPDLMWAMRFYVDFTLVSKVVPEKVRQVLRGELGTSPAPAREEKPQLQKEATMMMSGRPKERTKKLKHQKTFTLARKYETGTYVESAKEIKAKKQDTLAKSFKNIQKN